MLQWVTCHGCSSFLHSLACFYLLDSGISAPDAKLPAMWIDGGLIPTACEYE